MRTRNRVAEIARKNAYAVGFIPRDVYIHAYTENRLKTIGREDEITAFVMHSPLNAIVTVHQAAVTPELKRIDQGTELWMRLYQECLEANVERIRLHCATELPSNFFWEAMGCRCVAQREPGSLTARPANRWEVIFGPGEQLEAAVDEVMRNPSTQKIAAFLGITASLRKGVERRHRRKLFPGSRLRRKPKGEE